MILPHNTIPLLRDACGLVAKNIGDEMAYSLNQNIWLVEIDGENFLLLAPSEDEAKRLAELVDGNATVSRSGIPLMTVKDYPPSTSSAPEYVRKRKENFRKSSWR